MTDEIEVVSLADIVSDVLAGRKRNKPDRVHDETWGARPQNWETDPVKWRNWQWAVTSYGIENVKGPYHYYIGRGDLRADWWPSHMAAKNWVDGAAFRECFDKARELHK
jgi:hypothetical protein